MGGAFFYTRGEGMNIFITPHSAKGAPVLQAKPSGSPISHLRFKRGSSVPLTVTLVGVTEAGNLRIGMKRRDRYESPLLAYAAAATPDEAEGSGETSPAGVSFTLLLHERDECASFFQEKSRGRFLLGGVAPAL